MRAADLGKRQVNHLVHQHPIVREPFGVGISSHPHANDQPTVVGGTASADPLALRSFELDEDGGGRKAIVILSHDAGRAFDPDMQECAARGRGITHDDA